MGNHKQNWQFFRSGGFDQVLLSSAADLVALSELDQKLWATLACPINNLALDQRMLSYIDTDGDGRIRAPELLAAIDWTIRRLKTPDSLFSLEPFTRHAISQTSEGEALGVAAIRLLTIFQRDVDDVLTLKDTDDLPALFPANKPNGDGFIPAALASDLELQQSITDIIENVGSEIDRSGEPAVSSILVDEYAQKIDELLAWYDSASDDVLHPFGDQTDVAIAAIKKIREKIDDYFIRVDIAAYDPRAAAIMNGDEAELVRLAALNLSTTEELTRLPLAGLHNGNTLPLTTGVNPAWKPVMRALKEAAVMPLFGEQEHLTYEQWQCILERSQAYFSWQENRPNTLSISKERLNEFVNNNIKAKLLDLIEQDKEVGDSATGLIELDKLMRFQRGLITLLRNFISFQDFYGRQEKAIFQAGTLYIDGKSCDLVIQVNDINSHSVIATKSNNFLVYCACMRRGNPVKGKETMNIVAAITAGRDHELMVGRNGLFYDRDGNDWDATIVKLVENAVSVSEAFFSPYYRIANMVSEQIQKFASSRNQSMMQNASTAIANPGAISASATDAKPFDIAKFAGIFAAIGLAVGALGTALAAMFSGLLSLEWWQWPLMILGLVAFISGPSMLMAWFKLRKRSLGPILDANGWAVNSQARLSIQFGESLTHIAALPKGASKSLRDPYAAKRPWKIMGVVLVAVVAAAIWQYYQYSIENSEVVISETSTLKIERLLSPDITL